MDEYIEHLKNGTETCLVCEEKLLGAWTDYNGQIRCFNCGTTYQILGCHLDDDFLKEHKLKKSDIAQKYCDVYMLVPLLKDYWNETSRKVPFGSFMGNSPIPKQDYDDFYLWLKNNAEKYEEKYADDFYWERIKED